MKPSAFTGVAGLPLLITLLGSSPAFSQPLTWDATGVATADPVVAPGDGTGNWLDAGKWWDGANHVTWNNATHATTTAIFGSGGNSGDINLGTGVSAGGLRFNAVATGKGYQFAAGGTLTLGTNALIDIYSGTSNSGVENRIRFQNVIAGNGVTITNANDATAHASYVILNGANTWTGKLTLTGHTGSNGGLFVNVRNGSALTSLSEIEVKAATTLSLESNGMVIPNTTALRLAGAGFGGRGAIRADQSAVINSNIVLAADTRLGTNATAGVVVNLNGNISGNFTLTLNNDVDAMAGRYVFKGNNTFGALNVNKGNAQIGEGGVGTSGAGTVNLNGASAIISGTGSTKGGLLVSNGTIRPGDNGGVDKGVFTVNGNLNFTGLNGLSAARTAVELTLSSSSGISDRIAVQNNLRLHANGNIVVAFDGAYSPVIGDAFTLITYGNNLTLEGNAAAGTLFSLGTNMRSGANDGSEGNLDLPDISGSGYVWNVTAGATNSAIVITVAVPEPTMPVMAAAGTVLLSLRRRRR